MNLTLELQDIWFRYTGIGGSDRMVLRGVSLRLDEKQCTAIVGPSGSGKTTLIQLFTGLLRPTSGRVLCDGRNIWDRDFPLAHLRRRVGLVFQFPELQLFEETVYKDVAFGPRNLGFPPDELEERVHQALDAVELDFQKFASRSPFKLSEGEKRRAAIAGVLAMDPELIVFDEPTAGLDPAGVRRMAGIVQRLLEQGRAVVVVTHNMDFVYQIAERAVVMKDGGIIFDGKTHDLFTNLPLIRNAGLELPEFYQARLEFRKWLGDRYNKIKNVKDLLQLFEKSELVSK